MHRSLDSPLQESEFEELQSGIKSNPDARLMYGLVAQLHADLISQRQAQALCKVVQLEYKGSPRQPSAEPAKRSFSLPGWHVVRDSLRVVPRKVAASLLASGLSLGCGVGLLAATLAYAPLRFSPTPWTWGVSDDVVAQIESTHDVQWQEVSENPETPPTRGLRAGQQIRIECGLLRVVYRSGVAVILRGPAIYEIRSDHGGKLFSGKLSAVSTSEDFNIETPLGRLQIGAGHFGVDVESSTSDRNLSIFAFTGTAPGVPCAQFIDASGEAVLVSSGDAFKVDASGLVANLPTPVTDDYPPALPAARHKRYAESTIWLGNLFDDSKTASLTEAMLTDKYQSAAETIDLGVAAVHDGGLDVDVSLAEDGVLFNFSNVGGGAAKVNGLPANDTYRSSIGIPIRTTGKHFTFDIKDVYLAPVPKIEEGVGTSANELLTFDLQELRAAGRLNGRVMRFVSDRAGINDRELPLLDSHNVGRLSQWGSSGCGRARKRVFAGRR
jgi:hypothetical protein